MYSFYPSPRLQPRVERELPVPRPGSGAGHGALRGGGLRLHVPERPGGPVLPPADQRTERYAALRPHTESVS